MSRVKLKVPGNISALSHGGEEFEVSGGYVEVPEHAVDHLVASHGLMRPSADDEVSEDEASAPVDVDDMNKAELIAFLKGNGVEVPKGATIPDLRRLATEHLSSKG